MSYPSKKFMECLQYAAHQHRDQRRKDVNGTPYINHPINVATILSVEAGIVDENVLMAALLHDVVEDTSASFADVEQLFGCDVCNLVREVTDDKSLEKQERKRLQIVNAAKTSGRAKLIKLADKLDNLRDLQRCTPEGWTVERREQYFIWAKNVVDNLRNTNETLEKELDAIFRQRRLL